MFNFRKTLFDTHPDDADYVPLPEERPGGFEWGNRNNERNDDPLDQNQPPQ